jgi:hypothetical protein
LTFPAKGVSQHLFEHFIGIAATVGSRSTLFSENLKKLVYEVFFFRGDGGASGLSITKVDLSWILQFTVSPFVKSMA